MKVIGKFCQTNFLEFGDESAPTPVVCLENYQTDLISGKYYERLLLWVLQSLALVWPKSASSIFRVMSATTTGLRLMMQLVTSFVWLWEYCHTCRQFGIPPDGRTIVNLWLRCSAILEKVRALRIGRLMVGWLFLVLNGLCTVRKSEIC